MADTLLQGKPRRDEFALGRQINDKLRDKQLPQMVDWYSPTLLAGVAVRELISGTMGQYADQRQMQAATDRVGNEGDLVHRYDYSLAACTNGNCSGTSPSGERAIMWDPAHPDAIPRSYWVDYIADLGDGFEATYAMAYLMAPDELAVAGCRGAEGTHHTTAGRILVMGGDQAYPQATAKEYQERLLNPYNWAFSSTEPTRRKLFAIPGNHDWYDGLTAFDGVFCAARDRMSHGEGKKIGGWRSEQHRSYFALKMPHNWWIWGADIQLEGHLDDAQKDYFDLVSEHMGRDDKVIICLAEPSWLHAEYQNLREIVMLASKADAKICAVLAGDWHHYSRYYAKDLGISFITCGGGGAFAHATHSLKTSLKLAWPVKTDAPGPVRDPEDSYEHHLAEERVADRADYRESKVGATALEDAGAKSRSRRQRRERLFDPFLDGLVDDVHDCVAPHIYPSRIKSRLLSLWNLLFPFKHFKFALGLGTIYFLYSWVAFGIYCDYPGKFKQLLVPVDFTKVACGAAPGLAAPLALDRQARQAANGEPPNAATTRSGRQKTETAPAAAGKPAAWRTQKGWTEFTLDFSRVAMAKSIPFFVMVFGLWLGLIYYVDVGNFKGWFYGNGFVRHGTKVSIGTLHFLAHIVAIAFLTFLINSFIYFVVLATQDTIRASGATLSEVFERYRILGPFILIPIGGIIGGLVWGSYWAITCFLFSMHTGDAFGALALRNYKHFLRMKFEPDKVTIYPVKLDKVPGRKGWRPRRPSDGHLPHVPQLLSKAPLKPKLIEPPIEIRAADVWQRPALIEAAAQPPVPGPTSSSVPEPMIEKGAGGRGAADELLMEPRTDGPGAGISEDGTRALADRPDLKDPANVIAAVRQAIAADIRAVADPDIKTWCARRWRYLFLEEAVKDPVALGVATSWGDRRPPRQRIAERFLVDGAGDFHESQPPADTPAITNTTLLFCPGMLNGILPVRAFRDDLPKLEKRFSMRVLRADSNPLGSCAANVTDILTAFNDGKGLSAAGHLLDDGEATPQAT